MRESASVEGRQLIGLHLFVSKSELLTWDSLIYRLFTYDIFCMRFHFILSSALIAGNTFWDLVRLVEVEILGDKVLRLLSSNDHQVRRSQLEQNWNWPPRLKQVKIMLIVEFQLLVYFNRQSNILPIFFDIDKFSLTYHLYWAVVLPGRHQLWTLPENLHLKKHTQNRPAHSMENNR